MSYWLSIGTSEGYNAANNTSTVYVDLYLNSNNGTSWWGTTISGYISIGGNTSGFSRTSGGSASGSWSALIHQYSVTFTHDANGYRGAVGTAGYFGPGSNVPSLSVGGTTYGAVDFDRKPATPTSLVATLNANKTVTVVSDAVSSPAGTATYRLERAESLDNGATWSAYGNETTSTTTSQTLALTFGRLYKFRIRVSNSDGYSAYYTPTQTLFVPAGGKIWTGTAWVNATTSQMWNGTAWVTITTAKRFDGTNWVDLT